MPQPVTLTSFFANLLAFFGISGGPASSTVGHLATSVWLWIIIVGYALSVAGLVAIAYMTMRLFDLREREDAFYDAPLPEAAGGGAPASPRFVHIEALAASGTPSAWREAIIEADIMLDDALNARGYTGDGVGEKLRQVDRTTLASVADAWEAHKVRNQIAHEGSAFDLSETLATRTLARYQTVFRELGVI